MIARLLLGLFLGLALGAGAAAFEVEQTLDDPVLEGRAVAIAQQLRCLVCQNQSIADSNAGLAKDLRKIVRERLVAGDSDDEVIAFMTARYGDFVLLKPPVKPSTYLLWFGPALLLLGGAGAVHVYLRRLRARGTMPTPLSADERRRLEALLDDSDRS